MVDNFFYGVDMLGITWDDVQKVIMLVGVIAVTIVFVISALNAAIDKSDNFWMEIIRNSRRERAEKKLREQEEVLRKISPLDPSIDLSAAAPEASLAVIADDAQNGEEQSSSNTENDSEHDQAHQEAIKKLREQIDRLAEQLRAAAAQAAQASAKTHSAVSMDRYLTGDYMSVSDGQYSLRTPADAAREFLLKRLDDAKREMTLEEAIKVFQEVWDYEGRHNERRNLRKTAERQLDQTSSLKSRMISFFVMFNIGLLAALMYRPALVESAKELVLGLYISLAMFLVYVHRASNARALILLAIQEDLKRSHDVNSYLTSLKGKMPSERDIDILKLLSINRAEREKHAEHPYELVLKGISNSTILFKGGKLANVRSGKADADSSSSGRD